MGQHASCAQNNLHCFHKKVPCCEQVRRVRTGVSCPAARAGPGWRASLRARTPPSSRHPGASPPSSPPKCCSSHPCSQLNNSLCMHACMHAYMHAPDMHALLCIARRLLVPDTSRGQQLPVTLLHRTLGEIRRAQAAPGGVRQPARAAAGGGVQARRRAGAPGAGADAAGRRAGRAVRRHAPPAAPGCMPSAERAGFLRCL